MHYKTIVLELIQSRPALHERLRQQRQLLAAIERHATELKTLHQAWIAELHRTRPGSPPEQIQAEAMELALAELALPELDSPAESGEPSATDSTPPE